MHSLKRRGRVVALAATIALLAAACGSNPEPIDAAASEPVAATDQSTDEPTSGADSGSGPQEQDPAPEVDAATEEAETEGPSPAATDHLFPDLNTVNIADGSSLNLAQQLAGGDTPVMLWFFAPH